MNSKHIRIDAHQHYWSIERGDYGWITPDIPVLYRDFLPDDLLPNLEKHNIQHTIVVQAAPTIEETKYLLKMTADEPSVIGVVGYLDLQDLNHWNHYEQCAAYEKYAGFRIMIQDMPDPSVILDDAYIEALKKYAEHGVPVDLLVTSDQLETLAEMLDRVPGLHAVLDHIGKPDIAGSQRETWSDQIHRIANHSNVYCKISGMVTEADPHGWSKEDFVPYITEVMDSFGSDRVMFGSDWPVCLMAGTYDEVMDILVSALPSNFGENEQAGLFGENAKRFYKIKASAEKENL
ncbi:amidohydrolase family protein [Paenibacillus lemnae]|uniref:Amidohydrolase family protein n=1 Tax=Paenibacillus lemnae TaxID=1330551 RepID=A0A848M8J9_PAELE|nr:amidohydrolase family protein [Paenibacillus lemnae]NMO95834.1 amidohydrolase family protein [Paenibacillus lemnae]